MCRFKAPDLVMADQLFPKSMFSDLMFSGSEGNGMSAFSVTSKFYIPSPPLPNPNHFLFMLLQALKNKFLKTVMCFII